MAKIVIKDLKVDYSKYGMTLPGSPRKSMYVPKAKIEYEVDGAKKKCEFPVLGEKSGQMAMMGKRIPFTGVWVAAEWFVLGTPSDYWFYFYDGTLTTKLPVSIGKALWFQDVEEEDLLMVVLDNTVSGYNMEGKVVVSKELTPEEWRAIQDAK